MIVARAMLLLGAVWSMLVALGAGGDNLAPSARCLFSASAVALLAPLFWPGTATSLRATAWRLLAWSVATCVISGIATILLGGARPSWAALLRTGAMLLAISCLAHAVIAALESRRIRRGEDARQARDRVSRAVMLALALLGALPLWLGPTAELLSTRHPWAVDAALGASPLTHLAVAGDVDLLRTPWLYQHSNLASVQSDYPGLPSLAWVYAALCLLAVTAAMALRWQRIRKAPVSAEPTENPS